MVEMANGATGIRDAVYLVGRQAKHFSQFAHNSAVLKSAKSREQRGMRKTLKDIIGHIAAVAPRKIYVEVGGILAVEIDKALKIQV